MASGTPSQVRQGGADRTNTPTSYVAGSGKQSDDSVSYAFGGDEWEAPPKMPESLRKFLYTHASVSMEFISDFEQAAVVWDMESFMYWFSVGNSFEQAERLGVDFCVKYSPLIARLGTLYNFLKEKPLKMDNTNPDQPDYQSFNKNGYWRYISIFRRKVKAEWEEACSRLVNEAIEHSPARPTSIVQPEEAQLMSPRTPVENPSIAQQFIGRELNFSHMNPSPVPTNDPEVTRMHGSVVGSPVPSNPAGFMDRIQRREVERGNEHYDESTKVKRNFILTDIKPWDGR